MKVFSREKEMKLYKVLLLFHTISLTKSIMCEMNIPNLLYLFGVH